MRLSFTLLSVLLVGTPAHAYGPKATGRDWGEDYYGSPRHLAWVKEWAGDNASLPAAMLDTCLDHIITDEDGNTPKHVAKVPLTTLTTWCWSTIAPGLKEPTLFRDKTFRYPEGMVPNDD